LISSLKILSLRHNNHYDINTIIRSTPGLPAAPASATLPAMMKKPLIDMQAPLLDPDAPSVSGPQPGTAGRAWRERLHVALEKHEGLTPEAILNRLLDQLPEDPVGVFKAITATLPKELDVQTAPQQMHLTMLRVVAQAKARGIDLGALLEEAPALALLELQSEVEPLPVQSEAKPQPVQSEAKPQPVQSEAKPQPVQPPTLDFLR
jgi:hypothetical protein